MKAEEAAKLVKGKIVSCKEVADKVKIRSGFSADLMSDVLALAISPNKDTILITGITNPQIVRTAEILDIPVIVVARGKAVPQETIKLAEEKGIILIKTKLTVFVTSGILYSHGIKGARILKHGRKSAAG